MATEQCWQSWESCVLAPGALGGLVGILYEGGPRGLWVCLCLLADGRIYFPSVMFVCLLPFPFTLRSQWSLYREPLVPPAAACMASQTPTHCLQPPLPLLERSCWPVAAPAHTLIIITASAWSLPHRSPHSATSSVVLLTRFRALKRTEIPGVLVCYAEELFCLCVSFFQL